MTNITLLRTEKGRRLVEEKCKAKNLNGHVLEELINVEIDQIGKQRRHGIWDGIDGIFDKWNEDKDEVR